MRTIKASRRFGLDKNRCVIDKLNPENNGKAHCFENEPEDDAHLRTLLLYPRLCKPVSRLFVNKRPKDFNEDKHSLECVIISTIKASHLNGADPLLSIQRPFDGKLKRRKEGIQSFTSISLFVDDVERVLRDLYGDIDSDDLDDLLAAVRGIVNQFARYVRPDLKSEDDDAETIDLRVGINRPKYYGGVSSSEARYAHMSAETLAIRAIQVKANPDAYCRYTIKFIEALDKYWPDLVGRKRRRKGSLNQRRCLIES
jgi:hypothetical protein